MILELLTTDGIEPKHKGRGEYCSPCPACGGNDRFITKTDTGRYWCRQCGKRGDAIQYLRDFHGKSYQDAAEAVGKGAFLPGKKAPIIRLQPKKATPTVKLAMWQAEADQLISFARQELNRRHDVQTWLLQERGLTMETARRFNLGWIPADLYLDRPAWGLPKELKANGTPKKLFVPAGIVIQGPDRIRIRRSNPEKFGKYHVMQGSGTAPLEIGTPHETTAIIVESELDAILLAQEIRRKVYIVATGSTNMAEEHRVKLIEKLLLCPAVLMAFDSDNAGAKAAFKWMREHTSTLDIFRAPIPASIGKDITDAFLAGLDLNAWLSACMEIFAEKVG